MIIGFVGKKGSGKSTACAMVAGDLPDVARLNMKDALVNEIKESFPTLLAEIGNNLGMSTKELFETKPYPPYIRSLLQNYGTEVRRRDDTEYWINKWASLAEVMKASGFHIVVDDVRFLNEAEVVKRMGGIIVKLDREDLGDTDPHLSEMEMNQIKADYTISAKEGEHEKLRTELRELYKDQIE